MFLKQLGDLKCIEELFKEFYLRDLQDKVSLLNIVVKIANIEIFKISAGKNGKAPRAHSFSIGTKLSNQIRPKVYMKETEKAYSAKFKIKRTIKLYLK